MMQNVSAIGLATDRLMHGCSLGATGFPLVVYYAALGYSSGGIELTTVYLLKSFMALCMYS